MVTVPSAPTGLWALTRSGRATVLWTAPANDGGAAVTGYVVTPFLSGLALAPRTFNSPATTRTITGLINGSPYTFKVAAKNAMGTGAQSVASNRILIGVPSAPSHVVAVGASDRATVKWNAPERSGGAPITGYVVTPYIASVAQTPHTFASTRHFQTITGLTNNTLYTFTVAAINPNGTGLASAPISPILVGARSVPTVPTALWTVPGDGAVSLRWDAPSDNGSASVTRYLVTPFVGGVARPIRAYDARTRHLVNGLTNGSTYRFTVIAQSAAGDSAPSALSAPVTVGTPTAPPSVSATSTSSTVTVSWSPPASDNGHPVTGYVITPYVGSQARTPILVGVATSKILSGLTHANIYKFRVMATNANGTGPQSKASNAARPNTPPIAVADDYTTNEDTGLDVAAPGILGNDSDPDGDPLQIEFVTFPGGGFELRDDGSFYYEPAINADNDDWFYYRVGDGTSWSAPVRVSIDIIAVNDPPEVSGEQYEVEYETPLVVGSPGVLANDFDPVEFDGVSASGPISGPFHGTVVLQSNGAFTYTPDPGFSGVDFFTYLVSDSQPGGIGDVELDVLDPPFDG